jgi:hypothetical protein
MTRPIARALAVICTLTLLTGCGSIQERKSRADRVIKSVDLALHAKTARLIVSEQVELVLEGEQFDVLRAEADRRPPVRLYAEADFEHERVAYLATLEPGRPPQAYAVYSGTTVFRRKPVAASSSPPASAKRFRPWVSLNLDTIDPDDIDNSAVEVSEAARRTQTFRTLNNPLFLLSLLRGTLSGSVDVVGRESVHDIETTHYRFNIDREKAVDDEDERVQDVYESLFKSAFATAVVMPAEAWLDERGVAHRFRITLKSRLRRQNIADIHLTVDLFEMGAPLSVALPDKAETVKVGDLGALVQATSAAGS